MKIVLVGGGSGGHFYPLIAIAEALLEQAKTQKLIAPELYYLGPDVFDAESLVTYNITFRRVPAGKIRRYFSFRNILDSFKTFWGICVAIVQLFSIYPDVIMSKGGYTSVPVVIAAYLLRIPVVIHESDVAPGRANKFAARFARYIAISYDDAAAHFDTTRTALTGIPIRKELRGNFPENPFKILGVDSGPLILIIGGSSGAERINGLVIETLDRLLPKFTIVHQVGEENVAGVKASAEALTDDRELLEKYHIRSFLTAEQLHAALSAAEIVVSRAGSGTIHEIAIHGKPSILIPIPEEISHDQRGNAYAYARDGASSVIEEKNLTPNVLVAEIERITGNQELMQTMAEKALIFAPNDAAEKIAAALIEIGLEHDR